MLEEAVAVPFLVQLLRPGTEVEHWKNGDVLPSPYELWWEREESGRHVSFVLPS
jgi:hypothetical protein